MYDVRQIIRWFLEQLDIESGEVLTPLKVQKLLYYAQGWSLALTGEPLFDNEIEAWAHGPVVPSIYHELKKYRYLPLEKNEFSEYSTEFDSNTESLLNDIKTVYGRFDAKYLEALTHQEDPWLEARGDLEPEESCNEEITHESMTKFYREMHDTYEY